MGLVLGIRDLEAGVQYCFGMGTSMKISGGDARTTNNRMELNGAIKALQALKRSSAVILYTDSTYVKNGISVWINQWKRNNWKRNKKDLVKNVDLWQELDRLNSKHQVTWMWVKGHSGDEWNERADELARNAIPSRGTKI